jgi:hypothetical protein
MRKGNKTMRIYNAHGSKINGEFMFGEQRYHYTDIGSRVIAAIRLGKTDPSWYIGPPYAVAEMILDEYEQVNCIQVPSTN